MFISKVNFSRAIRKKKMIKAFSAFTKVKRINTREQATKYLHLAATYCRITTTTSTTANTTTTTTKTPTTATTTSSTTTSTKPSNLYYID